MNALVETPPHVRMRRFAITVGVLLTVCLVAALLLVHPWSPTFDVPDEKAVAARLLDQKLSGPRYFHPAETSAPLPGVKDGELRITWDEARSQATAIARERQLSPDQARKLDQLIDQLAEPSPSRAAGETTLNLLRLNLALDELR